MEDVKLSQPDGPTKNERNDLPPLATPEPKQSTKSLSAEERQIDVRMRENNYSRLRIAEFLGRHLQVVHDALRQLGTINSKRANIPAFRLSVPELERFESLRKQGLFWNTICSQESVDIGFKALSKTFARQMIAMGRPLPVPGHMKVTLSSADL